MAFECGPLFWRVRRILNLQILGPGVARSLVPIHTQNIICNMLYIIYTYIYIFICSIHTYIYIYILEVGQLVQPGNVKSMASRLYYVVLLVPPETM